MEFHNSSCRNRNCPNCQAVLKEIWVDRRRAEVIDSPTFMWCLPFPMNWIPWFTAIRISCITFYTDAPPKHFWNYPRIRSISEQHQELFRFFTRGTKSWTIMYTCTVSFPAVVSPQIGEYESPKQSFSSLWRFYGTSSKENIWLTWIPSMKIKNWFFLLPAKICRTLIAGRSGKMLFMRRTGVPT